MTKTTRALSGASKDTYFRAVIAGERDVPDHARERLIGTLQKGVSQVRVRLADAPSLLSEAPSVAPGRAESRDEAPQDAFDPFSPNVLVVVRREGADAALQQLKSIADVRHLKLLAREQQLSIGDEHESISAIAAAIVEAAQKRIANMRAAAR